MQFLWAFRYNPSRPTGLPRFAYPYPRPPPGVVSRLRRIKSKRPRLQVCHQARSAAECTYLSPTGCWAAAQNQFPEIALLGVVSRLRRIKSKRPRLRVLKLARRRLCLCRWIRTSKNFSFFTFFTSSTIGFLTIDRSKNFAVKILIFFELPHAQGIVAEILFYRLRQKRLKRKARFAASYAANAPKFRIDKWVLEQAFRK
jgi:hypothetical protein